MANGWEIVSEDPWAVVSEEEPKGPGGKPLLRVPGVEPGKPADLKGPGEVLADVGRGLAHVPANIADLPTTILNAQAPGFLPQGVQDLLNRPLPGTENIIPPTPAEPVGDVLSNFIDRPQTGAGRAANVLGLLAAPAASTSIRKGVQALTRQSVSKALLKGEASALERTPDALIRNLGLDDVTKAAGFEKRFPNMARVGAKNADEALKKGSAIYTDAKNSEAFARTQLHPTQDYVEGLRRLQVTEDLPKGLAKQLSGNLEGISVADRFHLIKDVRDVARRAAKSGNLEKSGQYSKVDDLLQRMEPAAGTDKAVIDKIAEADALWAEGMGLKRIEDAINAASLKGSSKGLTLSGQPTAKAQDILDGLRKLGPAAEKSIPNYDKVVSLLQETMRRGGELSKTQQGKLAGLLGTIIDWRVLAVLGTGVVGSSIYHQGKAIKALYEGR